MKLLANKEPKSLINYLGKRLGSFGYKIYKSDRSPQRTYYLKSDKKGYKKIRLSDHNLHQNQYKENQIDVVIQDDFSVEINKIKLYPSEIQSYRSVIAEFLISKIR